MLASCPAFAWRAATVLVPLPWKRIAAAAKWAHFAPWALLEVQGQGAYTVPVVVRPRAADISNLISVSVPRVEARAASRSPVTRPSERASR